MVTRPCDRSAPGTLSAGRGGSRRSSVTESKLSFYALAQGTVVIAGDLVAEVSYSAEFLRFRRSRGAMFRNEAVDDLIANSVPGGIPERLLTCVSQDFR